jgi:chromosome segregation ATPase
MSAATAEADRLRKQKAANEKELDGLWQLLTASDEHAKRLFAEVEEAKAAAEAQRQQRQVAEVRLNELAQAAIARDTETLELRDQRDHFASELAQAAKVRADLSDQLRKAEMRAAVGSYLKGVGWFIGIVIVLVIAVKVIAFFKPL